MINYSLKFKTIEELDAEINKCLIAFNMLDCIEQWIEDASNNAYGVDNKRIPDCDFGNARFWLEVYCSLLDSMRLGKLVKE